MRLVSLVSTIFDFYALIPLGIQKRSNYALWCWAIWLVTFGVFILTIEDTCWVFLSGIGGRTAINLCTLIWQNSTYCNRTLRCWRSVQMTFAILALTPKRSAPQLSPCRIDRLQVEFSVDWWERLSRVQLGGIKFELFAKKIYYRQKSMLHFGDSVGLHVLRAISSMWMEFI